MKVTEDPLGADVGGAEAAITGVDGLGTFKEEDGRAGACNMSIRVPFAARSGAHNDLPR